MGFGRVVLAVAAASAALSSVTCALIVGDVDGHAVLGPDGSVVHATDAMAYDRAVGRSDAARDVMLDTPRSTTDTGADARVDSGADAGPPNLLTNPSFGETAGGGCGVGWNVSLGTGTISTFGRTDHSSCMVCSTAAGVPPTTLAQPGMSWTATDASASGYVVASAYLHAVPDSGIARDGDVPTGQASLEVYFPINDGGGMGRNDRVGNLMPVSPSGWVTTTSSWPANNPPTATENRFSFELFVIPVGACVLVDDVSFQVFSP